MRFNYFDVLMTGSCLRFSVPIGATALGFPPILHGFGDYHKLGEIRY